MEVFQGITKTRLCEILEKITNVRAAMLGDICIDVYWHADMTKSELSRETPHFPLPVVKEQTSPGAGGNTAVNLAALKPAKVQIISVIGDDWRGAELMKILTSTGIDTGYIIRVPNITTNAYCKPLRKGISSVVYEDPRLDFANYTPLNRPVEDALIAALDSIAKQIDVLCVSDQIIFGVVTNRVRDHVIELAKNGLLTVVDSRDRIGNFNSVILKPNEVEGMKAACITDSNNNITGAYKTEDFAKAALKLSVEKESEVLMTIGSNGSLYANNQTVIHIPAHNITGPVDIVGAGDTFLSGFSLALAAGASRPEAAFFAGLCSEVTIRQIGTTGTAAADQVLARYDEIHG